jgi:glutaconyl-CoA/methylmalonyl-CoA decarboxylase subunit gamma
MKKYELTIKGNKYTVEVKEFGAKSAKVDVNGKVFDVAVAFTGEPQAVFTPPVPRSTAATRPVEQQQAPADNGAEGFAIKAPMPGLILKILVKPGDSVSVGQKVMSMEAMKMENDINTTVAGTVKSVQVKEGDNVKEHQALITIG